ncbi:MAG TPA: SRPBCC family protein [Aggregatilineales bacterium]|nr:SRPBCC family protein [Aggregatilineales bacterium]
MNTISPTGAVVMIVPIAYNSPFVLATKKPARERIMPRVEKSIVIAAPVAQVFEAVADEPERMVEWWPPIELQERITPPPTQLGSRSRYVYNMSGFRLKGEHRVEQFEPNQALLVKTTSGIDSAFHFIFASADNDATKLTIAVDYQLPGAIVGQLLNKALIEGENARNLDLGLKNLKKMLETNLRPHPNSVPGMESRH